MSPPPDPLAAALPDKPALIEADTGRQLTFQELNRLSNRWANALAGLGVARADRCLHLHRNCVDAFPLHHGLRKLASVSVPGTPAVHPGELATLIDDCDPVVVAADPAGSQAVAAAHPVAGNAGRWPGVRCWVGLGGRSGAGWTPAGELLDPASDTEPAVPVGGAAPTLIYTSGTSGAAKGVWRHQGIRPAAMSSGMEVLQLGEGDVHLMAGPGHHSGPWGFATLQQMIGATCVVLRAFHPRRVPELIERHRVTTTYLLPLLVQRVLDLPEGERARYDLSSLSLVLVTGAPFPPDLKLRAVDYFGDCVYESYGSTETGMITLIGPQEMRLRPRSCGRPLPGVSLRLLGEDGTEAGPGEPGVVWARTPSMFDEYFRRPEESRQSLVDGYFSPGDIGYLDREGYLYIIDRKTDFINFGGLKIAPAEVEAALAAHPAVADCAVIGVPATGWGELVHALVQLRPGATASPDDLVGHCAGRLSPIKLPARVEFVEALPRDAGGKLRRSYLRRRYLTGQVTGGDHR